MTDAVLRKLTDLHFAGIIKTLDMRIEQAAKENMSYAEFLEVLISDEYLNRARNRHTKLMNQAKLPQHKTLEEFNFSWQPCLNRQEIYSMGTCEFIRRKENITFIGLPGTGKTHLILISNRNDECKKRGYFSVLRGRRRRRAFRPPRRTTTQGVK